MADGCNRHHRGIGARGFRRFEHGPGADNIASRAPYMAQGGQALSHETKFRRHAMLKPRAPGLMPAMGCNASIRFLPIFPSACSIRNKWLILKRLYRVCIAPVPGPLGVRRVCFDSF